MKTYEVSRAVSGAKSDMPERVEPIATK